jgi:hypothetical protein
MTDEQRQDFQTCIDACRAVWAEITRIVREAARVIKSWWRSLPRAIRRMIVPDAPTIMRKKIRRYVTMNC